MDRQRDNSTLESARFQELVSTYCGPILEEHGFRRLGDEYQRWVGSVRYRVMCQYLKYGLHSGAGMVIWLGIKYKEVDDLLRSHALITTVSDAETVDSIRANIGYASAPYQFEEWTIDPSQEVGVLGRRIAQRLHQSAIPFFEKRGSIESFLKHLGDDDSKQLAIAHEACVIAASLWLTGDQKGAIQSFTKRLADLERQYQEKKLPRLLRERSRLESSLRVFEKIRPLASF